MVAGQQQWQDMVKVLGRIFFCGQIPSKNGVVSISCRGFVTIANAGPALLCQETGGFISVTKLNAL